MHGASTAHRHATAEFGAGQPELVADDPEQRRVLGNVEITFLAIDLKLHHVSHSLFSGGFQWWTSPCVQEAEATRDSAPSRKPAGPKVGKLTSLQIGRASGRERVGKYESNSVVAVQLKKKKNTPTIK